MPHFPLRPLAVFVLGLLSATGVLAEQSGSGTAAVAGQAAPAMGVTKNDGVTPRLRTERRFNVMGRKKPVRTTGVGHPYPVETEQGVNYPMFIIADRLEGRSQEVANAAGNVELRRAGSLVYGDTAVYWPLDDELEATGNVRLYQEGQEVQSSHMRLQVSEQIGYAEYAQFVFVHEIQNKFYRPITISVTNASSNAASSAPMTINVASMYGLPTTTEVNRPSLASGTAERAEFEGDNQIRLLDATYSTCKPGQTDWYMRASEMHLDYDIGVGEARDASIWFKDVPLLYMPYGTFSLNSEARSGFLHPIFATSTRDGIDFTVPYYWSMAPNYGATFYPRYMSKRGFQIGAEFEYFSATAQNNSRVEYMPYDQLEGHERYAYKINHNENLGQGWNTTINYNRVSDNYYFQDLSSRLIQTTQVQLPQQLVVGYAPSPWIQTNMQVLQYQTLQTDPSSPVAIPYFIEPQLNAIALKPDIAGMDFLMLGQATRFTHPTLVDGNRLVLYPQLSLPLVHPAFSVTPKIGLHVTEYGLSNQVDQNQPSNISRVMPTFTLDSTVVLERETSLMDKAFIQTLEPRLYYVNIPYRNQSNIPVFDTAQTDFNFAQIFSENRYSGYDRINDANQLTAGLTTRMLNPETGVEQFKAMIGQRYYFTTSKVTLPGQAPQSQGYSNLITAFTGLVLPKTYTDVAWEYDYRESINERFSAGIRYQPELGKVLSMGYRYVNGGTVATTGTSSNSATPVNQIDISGQWPLSNNLFVVGRYNYSWQDTQLIEAIAGLEYNSGCWAFRAVAQRLEAIAGTPNTTLFLQLELTDFGSIGSNPINMLRRSIPGYGKSNELMTASSLLSTP